MRPLICLRVRRVAGFFHELPELTNRHRRAAKVEPVGYKNIMKTEIIPLKDRSALARFSAAQRLAMGSSLNYGRRFPSGNFVHLELWSVQEGLRYTFTWTRKPSDRDLFLLREFKEAAAEDICQLLGASRVAFPDSDADTNTIAMAK